MKTPLDALRYLQKVDRSCRNEEFTQAVEIIRHFWAEVETTCQMAEKHGRPQAMFDFSGYRVYARLGGWLRRTLNGNFGEIS